MAKTFSVPSFSMPKVNVNTSALKSSMKIPDISAASISNTNPEALIESLGGIQKPSMADIKNALKSSTGITSMSDVEKTLKSGLGKQDVTVPTSPEDVKKAIMNKADEFRSSGNDFKQNLIDKANVVKDTIKTVKEDGLAAGVSGLVPQEYKDIKQSMDDAGMSIDVKDFIGQFKGGK